MNEIITKFSLTGETFMSEMHLRQLGFTYSTFGPFTKNKERIKKFKETGDSRYIYQNELDKVCFQHDMAYGDFKNSNRRTFGDKVLRDKAFNIVKDPKYDGYQRGLASMVLSFLIKRLLAGVLKAKIFPIKNWRRSYTNQLLENLVKEKCAHLLQVTFGCRFSRYGINK